MSEFASLRWFNISIPSNFISVRRNHRPPFLRIAQVFNRHCADGNHFWGFGILQVGHRHLFYIGHSGISIAFIGRIP